MPAGLPLRHTPTPPNKITGKNLHWPVNTPNWVKQTLETEASAQQLTNVPPQLIAGYSLTQHRYGTTGSKTGLGTGGPTWVNSSGYGGYFGLGATQPYPGGTPTRTELETASYSSFRNQASILASALAEYLKQYTGTAIKAVNVLTKGTPTGMSGSAATIEYTVFHGKKGSLTPNTGITGPTIKLPGVGGMLQSITNFLNPKSGGVGTVLSLGSVGAVKQIAARGLVATFSMAIALIGLYIVAKGPASSVAGILKGTKQMNMAQFRAEQTARKQQALTERANIVRRSAHTSTVKITYRGTKANPIVGGLGTGNV